MKFQISTTICGEISSFTLTKFFSKYKYSKTLSQVKANLQTWTIYYDRRILNMLIKYLSFRIPTYGILQLENNLFILTSLVFFFKDVSLNQLYLKFMIRLKIFSLSFHMINCVEYYIEHRIPFLVYLRRNLLPYKFVCLFGWLVGCFSRKQRSKIIYKKLQHNNHIKV